MIYLDNAATTMRKPDQVLDAVVQAMTTLGNASRGAHGGALRASRGIYDTRCQLARLFGGIFGPFMAANPLGLGLVGTAAALVYLGLCAWWLLRLPAAGGGG